MAKIRATDQFVSALRLALYKKIGLKATDLKVSVSFDGREASYRVVVQDRRGKDCFRCVQLISALEFDIADPNVLAEWVAKRAAKELCPRITKLPPANYWYTDKDLVKIKAPDLYGIDFPGRKTAAAPAADDWYTYNDWQKIKASNLLKTAAINFPRSKTAPASESEPEDDSKYPEWI